MSQIIKAGSAETIDELDTIVSNQKQQILNSVTVEVPLGMLSAMMSKLKRYQLAEERRPSHRERRPMDLNLCDQLIEEGKSPQEISIALRGDKSLSGAVQQRIMSKKMREVNND